MMQFRYESLSFCELGQRSNQEDSIYPVAGEPCGGLFILCDGMGGHERGEVASATVCSGLEKSIPRKGVLTEAQFKKALAAACAALDRKDDPTATKKMGTTLTLLKLHDGGALAAHVGDSRIYQIRPSEKRILYVTRDHSLVNDLVAIGELTPEEARISPQKNVITRALQPGSHGRPDIAALTDIRPGDWFYLCSDGMLEQMEDAEIVHLFSAPDSIADKARILREKTAGNRDNHSAHLVHILTVKEAAPQKKCWLRRLFSGK